VSNRARASEFAALTCELWRVRLCRRCLAACAARGCAFRSRRRMRIEAMHGVEDWAQAPHAALQLATCVQAVSADRQRRHLAAVTPLDRDQPRIGTRGPSGQAVEERRRCAQALAAPDKERRVSPTLTGPALAAVPACRVTMASATRRSSSAAIVKGRTGASRKLCADETSNWPRQSCGKLQRIQG